MPVRALRLACYRKKQYTERNSFRIPKKTRLPPMHHLPTKSVAATLFCFGITGVFLPTETAWAIPPPEFIIQVASQMAAFFTIGLVACSALTTMAYQLAKAYLARHQKWFWAIALILTVAVSGGGAYYFDQNARLQQAEKLNLAWQKQIKPSASPQTSPPQATETPNTISNAELKDLLRRSADSGVYLLDARESVEHELGRIPGSVHIRAADLMDGRYRELPTDRPIVVICWSGLRGNEVTAFLKGKGLDARALASGVNSWVAEQGAWVGEVDFYKGYADDRYRLVYSTAQTRALVDAGTILVDVRNPLTLRNIISESVAIPMLYLPTSELKERLAKIPRGTKVLTICDDLASCFDATATGIELERHGGIYLGKYITPWEW